MHPIIQFYNSDSELCERLGFSPDSCLDADDAWWEGCHNHIQWLFPLKEPSNYNPNAPLVTDEVIATFTKEHFILLSRFAARFLVFAMNRFPLWTPIHDHNYLRITRIIKCLNLFGSGLSAICFFNIFSTLVSEKLIEVSEETFNYWSEAVKEINPPRLSPVEENGKG